MIRCLFPLHTREKRVKEIERGGRGTEREREQGTLMKLFCMSIPSNVILVSRLKSIQSANQTNYQSNYQSINQSNQSFNQRKIQGHKMC